ncbi:hypothetical protein FOMPIDRAFT_1056123 [Fomitopsis schrenkii]|uniref:Mitochondrial chaperone BCS1-like ATPase lid domain-containing protein n=1 Tax=Fomitopsis schrenkii TaxID=2126942 RepID=S8F2X6_FOMSC|nr:hypothetical protein FOMPIDRAFT_1056123 [Fomitopsis schrenkii]
MDDTELNTLISIMPRRCIALIEDIDAALPHSMQRELPTGHPQTDDQGNGNGAEGNREGDGPPKKGPAAASVTVWILFATTNNYKALDAALCRPGRMDLHVEFKLASRYQAEHLYKSFFVPDGVGAESDGDASRRDKADAGSSEKTPLLQPSLGHPSRPSAHGLPGHEVLALAARFAKAIPERELSMASLQGYLMMYKTRPGEAVDDVQQWIEQERQARGKRA